MRTDAKIAAAVAGGYLLGRKRNAKLALGLGLWLTGRRISLDPAHLTRQLAGLPLVGTVRDQIGGELGAVGRKVLTTAVTDRADRWAENLGRRTASLRGTAAGQKSGQDPEADASRADEEPADASAADEDVEDAKDAENADEPATRSRRSPRKRAAATAASASRVTRSRATRATKERA